MFTSFFRALLDSLFGPNARRAASAAAVKQQKALSSVAAAQAHLRSTQQHALSEIRSAASSITCAIDAEYVARNNRDEVTTSEIDSVEASGEKKVTALVNAIELTQRKTSEAVSELRAEQAEDATNTAARIKDAQDQLTQLDAAAAQLSGTTAK